MDLFLSDQFGQSKLMEIKMMEYMDFVVVIESCVNTVFFGDFLSFVFFNF